MQLTSVVYGISINESERNWHQWSKKAVTHPCHCLLNMLAQSLWSKSYKLAPPQGVKLHIQPGVNTNTLPMGCQFLWVLTPSPGHGKPVLLLLPPVTWGHPQRVEIQAALAVKVMELSPKEWELGLSGHHRLLPTVVCCCCFHIPIKVLE
jgi:hypothetical protein